MRFAYLLAYLSIAGLVHGLAIDHSKAAPKRGSKDNKGTKGAKDNKATTNHKDWCVIEASTDLKLVGHDYPTQRHCESRVPAPVFINHIQTWSNGNSITAIKFGYNDKKYPEPYGEGFGSDTKSFTLDPGERFAAVSLYENGASHSGKGVRLGKISVRTTNGKVYDLGNSNAGRPHVIDVGTGLLIGATIRHGTEIDQLGLHFLAGSIEKIEMNNFKFVNNVNGTDKNIRAQSENSFHYYNSGKELATYYYHGMHDKSVKNTWSSQTSKEWENEVKASVTVGVSFAALSLEARSKWSQKQVDMTSFEDVDTYKMGFTHVVTLKPGHGQDCTATFYKAEGKFGYTVDTTLHLGGTKKFWFTEQGTLHTVSKSQMFLNCSDNNSPTAPPGFQLAPDTQSSQAALQKSAPAKLAPAPDKPATSPVPGKPVSAQPAPAPAKPAPAPAPAPAKPAPPPAPAPAKPAPPAAPVKPAPPPAAAKPAPPPAAAKPAPAPGKPAAPPAPAPAPAKPANTPLAPKPAAAADPAKPATGKPVVKKVNN